MKKEFSVKDIIENSKRMKSLQELIGRLCHLDYPTAEAYEYILKQWICQYAQKISDIRLENMELKAHVRCLESQLKRGG